jgi:hypothetical protein
LGDTLAIGAVLDGTVMKGVLVCALAIPVCLVSFVIAAFSREPEERYLKLSDWLFNENS